MAGETSHQADPEPIVGEATDSQVASRQATGSDILRELAWFSLSRCHDDGPMPPYAARMSSNDAVEVIFGSSTHEIGEDS